MRGVEKLLKAGDSIDVKDSAGRTLLHRACEEVDKELPFSLIQGHGIFTASRKNPGPSRDRLRRNNSHACGVNLSTSIILR